jgi:hypothetical protein
VGTVSRRFKIIFSLGGLVLLGLGILFSILFPIELVSRSIEGSQESEISIFENADATLEHNLKEPIPGPIPEPPSQ